MAIERIHGVLTGIVRHSDRHNIVTLYTRERGRVSFLTPAGGGRSGRLRNSRLMPLALIEADVSFKANRDLQTLGSFSVPIPWRDIYFHPVKSSQAFFIAEFLNTFLRYAEADPNEWDYIVKALGCLETEKEGTANFHIAFLIGFLHYAGIFPDFSDMGEEAVFDLRGGISTSVPPGHSDILSSSDTLAARLISRMTLDNCRYYRFSVGQRRMVLDHLLRYYAIHFPGIGSLKSPAVLAEVFS